MIKRKMELIEWSLSYREGPYLTGTALYLSKYGRNFKIWHTTPMVEYTYGDGVLTFETQHSIYTCNIKDMIYIPFENTNEDWIRELNTRYCDSHDMLEKIILSETKIYAERLGIELPHMEKDEFLLYLKERQGEGQKERRREESARKREARQVVEGKDNVLFLDVINNKDENPIFYKFGFYMGFIMPRRHSGMISDSILYMKYRNGKDDLAIDFRYFPQGWGSLETYSWSDNIKFVVIRNSLSGRITFNGTSINPGEVKEFTQECHTQGLVSPDCYNGKSIFSE